MIGRAPPTLLHTAGNLAAFVRVHAEATPERAALRFADGQQQTYGELVAHGAHLARALQAQGVSPSTRVLVLVPVGPSLYPLLYAVMAVGAVSIVVDSSMPRAALRQALRQAQPDLVVCVAQTAKARLLPELWRARWCSVGAVGGVWRALAGHPLQDVMSPQVSENTDEMVRVAASHDALITFTTGSTGEPRGARRTHGQLNAQGDLIDRSWPHDEGDIDAATLPVFATTNLAAGITTCFPVQGRVDLDDVQAVVVRDRLRHEGVTSCGGSPAFVDALARAVLRDGVGVPTLRRLAVGGAPLTIDVAERLRAAFPGAHCRVVYGATECEPVSSVDIDEVLRTAEHFRAGAGCLVGVPHPEVRVHLAPVVDDDSSLGEVCVAGAHVLQAWIGAPAATLDVAGTRYVRTGDVARRDDDGRLWLLGRTTERVVGRDGVVRWPLSVEAIAGARGARAALVQVGMRSVLAVENSDEVKMSMLSELADAVVPVSALPLDHRHRARIDRRTLATLLQRCAP